MQEQIDSKVTDTIYQAFGQSSGLESIFESAKAKKDKDELNFADPLIALIQDSLNYRRLTLIGCKMKIY